MYLSCHWCMHVDDGICSGLDSCVALDLGRINISDDGLQNLLDGVLCTSAFLQTNELYRSLSASMTRMQSGSPHDVALPHASRHILPNSSLSPIVTGHFCSHNLASLVGCPLSSASSGCADTLHALSNWSLCRVRQTWSCCS